MRHPHIALIGKSGAGKTEIANFLCSQYSYVRASSGDVCRDVCQRLFRSESKQLMNAVTDAMKQIDDQVWVKTALAAIADGGPIVFDSVRFFGDLKALESIGFQFWRVLASEAVRNDRLRLRNQDYEPSRDGDHRSETELDGVTVTIVIENDGSDICQLHRDVNTALARTTRR